MKAIIISGGKIEDDFALEWLTNHKYDFLIAADSGMDFLYRNKIVPNVVAGDFDSVDADAYESFVREGAMQNERIEVLRLNPIKDDTDTEFVVREAIRRGATDITILGGTGTRLDHVMGNVHLLGIGMEQGIQIELLDSHNRIRMTANQIVIHKGQQFGDYVSVLPFAGVAKGVTLQGFKYPLENATMTSFSSLGISNEIVAESATIEVKHGIVLVIESRD